MTCKMKIKKTEMAAFNGEWITNGFFAADAKLVQIADKGLQALVDAGTIFQRRGGQLTTNDETVIPDMSRILDPLQLSPGEAKTKGIERTQFMIRYSDTFRAIYKRDDGKLVLVAEHLADMLDSFDNLFQQGVLEPLVAYSEAGSKIELHCVAMPIQSEDNAVAQIARELIGELAEVQA